MTHPSQVTKAEYSNKHESNITSKMANIWERKIGSDKDHKPSPTSVAKQTSMKMETINPLTKAGSNNASSTLRRKNTKEIVNAFERMASNSAQKLGSSGFDKVEKKKSMTTTKYGTKEDLKTMIERISKQMKNLSDDIATLESKIDAL